MLTLSEWLEMMHQYVYQALKRAHDAETEREARYWKKVARELDNDIKLQGGYI